MSFFEIRKLILEIRKRELSLLVRIVRKYDLETLTLTSKENKGWGSLSKLINPLVQMDERTKRDE